MNSDEKYEQYLETVMKIKFPYEYALLKSDLKANLHKLAEEWPTNQGPTTYKIAHANLARHLKYWH